MSSLLPLFLAVLFLLLGLAVGFFVGGRPLAALRAERDQAIDAHRRAATELAAAEERGKRVYGLQDSLDATREERDEARTRLAAQEAVRAAEAAAFEQRLAELRDAKDLLARQFGEIGGKLLETAEKQFLARADQRFTHAEERGEARMKALLQPMSETLKRYEEGLAQVEKNRAGSYGELKEAIAQLTQGNDLVRRETQRLTNVMRSSPKARGRWGEEQLRNILESAGLAENVDFSLQSSVTDGDRQLRPDCVINLPGGRCIVVDVKCPLVAFEQAYDEEDEGRRAALLLQHANAMKTYAADLGRKSYWRQFDLSPDFVIMFIPGEHFLSAAAERAPDLIETAYRGGVIVASTINMLALAKVMAGMWRQEALAHQAQEVAEVGKELYKRILTMGGHVTRLGRNLGQAAGAYNDFVGSLESQVMTQAKRFETLKIDTAGKSLDTLPVIEPAIRPLTKLDSSAETHSAS